MSTLSTTNIKHPSSASNNIVLDSSGRVGIGTASPGRIFQVADSSNAFLSAKCGSVEGFVNVTATQVNLESSAGIPVTISPGGTLRGEFDTSGNLKFNSGYGSVATAYGVRAWVNFQGTGTVDIRASGNVSSITDNGSGDYTVNFATALSDASYCAFGSVIGSSNTDATDAFVSAGFNAATATHTTSAFRFTTAHRTQGAQDYNQVQVAVIR